MKRLAFAAACVAACVFSAMGESAKQQADRLIEQKGDGTTIWHLGGATEKQIKAITSRQTITSREIHDGAIIEHWRGGAREWSVTNALVPVVGVAATNTFSKRLFDMEKRAQVAERLAELRASIITAELDKLKEDKAELAENIGDAAYLLIRPWLRIKLSAVEARIKLLEARID